MKPALTILFLTLLWGSCTITKRVHRPGWHIEWNRQHTSDAEARNIGQDAVGAFPENQTADVRPAPEEVFPPEDGVMTDAGPPEEIPLQKTELVRNKPVVERATVRKAYRRIGISEKRKDEALRFAQDKGSVGVFFLGLILALVGITILVALAVDSSPFMLEGLKAGWYLLVSGVILIGIALLNHQVWKKSEQKQRKEEKERDSEQYIHRPRAMAFFVLFVFMFTLALGLITGYTYLLAADILAAGIIAMIATCAFGTLTLIEWYKYRLESWKPITPAVAKGRTFLFTALMVGCCAVVLLGLNGWVLGAATGIMVGLTTSFIFFMLTAFILAVIGINIMSDVMGW